MVFFRVSGDLAVVEQHRAQGLRRSQGDSLLGVFETQREQDRPLLSMEALKSISKSCLRVTIKARHFLTLGKTRLDKEKN